MTGESGPPASRAQPPGPAPSRRPVWLGTLAAGGLASLVALLLAGPSGLLGGVLGTLLVAGFFSSGALPLLVTDGLGARVGAGLAVLLLSYTLRLAVALLLLRVLSRTDAVDVRSLGITVVVTALTWSGLQLLVVLRSGATG